MLCFNDILLIYFIEINNFLYKRENAFALNISNNLRVQILKNPVNKMRDIVYCKINVNQILELSKKKKMPL